MDLPVPQDCRQQAWGLDGADRAPVPRVREGDPEAGVTSTDLLSSDLKWMRGFEAGVVFTLMSNGCPFIKGNYANDNEEQLFVFAHQLGYAFQWTRLTDGSTAIEFTLVAGEEEAG